MDTCETADDELARVVVWLRREAATMTEMSGKTTMTLQGRARHEHRETNDG